MHEWTVEWASLMSLHVCFSWLCWWWRRWCATASRSRTACIEARILWLAAVNETIWSCGQCPWSVEAASIGHAWVSRAWVGGVLQQAWRQPAWPLRISDRSPTPDYYCFQQINARPAAAALAPSDVIWSITARPACPPADSGLSWPDTSASVPFLMGNQGRRSGE